MAQETFISEKYDKNVVEDYVLNIAYFDNALTYALINKIEQVVVFKQLPNDDNEQPSRFIERVIEEDDVKLARYNKLTFFTLDERALLVPKKAAQNREAASFLNSIYDVRPDRDLVRKDEIDKLETANCYAVDKAMDELIARYYPKRMALHAVTALAALHHRVHQQFTKKMTACVELRGDKFYYLIFREEQLLFCNQYAMYAPEDVIYYIFRVNQTLRISPKELYIYITGKSNRLEEIVSLLRTYFVNFSETEPFFPRENELNRARIFHEDYSFLFRDYFENYKRIFQR